MSSPPRRHFLIPLSVLVAWSLLVTPASAQEKPPTPSPAETKAPAPAARELVPLNKAKTILLDRPNRKVIIEAKVVLREGMLEMLLCKRQTKEHESILAFNGEAKIIHAGLLALDMEPGTPVVFVPTFQPPTGPKLKIELIWKDKAGKEQRSAAHEWIRHSIHRYFAAPLDAMPAGLDLPREDDLRYDATNKELSWYGPMSEKQRDHYLSLSENDAWTKAIKSFHDRTRSRPLRADFVFAGSQFAVDEQTGEKIYLAESGDVICVANFPSAMIDLAARSSAEGQESLLYEAWTERIPPRDTRVRVEISPMKKVREGGEEENQERVD